MWTDFLLSEALRGTLLTVVLLCIGIEPGCHYLYRNETTPNRPGMTAASVVHEFWLLLCMASGM